MGTLSSWSQAFRLGYDSEPAPAAVPPPALRFEEDSFAEDEPLGGRSR